MNLRKLINYVKGRIKSAMNKTIEAWVTGEIETEPSCTDRFFGRIEEAFDEYSDLGFESTFDNFKEYDENLHFSVRTLRDRGPGASEKKYGADICIIASIQDSEGNGDK